MPLKSIGSGADPFRAGSLGKGGLPVRLFFWLPFICAAFAASAAPTASTPATPYADDALESLFGFDLERQIWVRPLPAPAPDTAPPARFSASMDLGYLNAIRRSGGFFSDFGGTASAFELATAAVPGLRISLAAERADRQRALGDTATSVDLGAASWNWTGRVAYHIAPWLIPTVTVGGGSGDTHDHSLRSLELKGRIAGGFSWSAELGRKRQTFPLNVQLRNYRPLSLPLQWRASYERAALEYRRGAWTARWTGEWIQSGYASVPEPGYSLGDSGSAWQQAVNLAWERVRHGAGLKASADMRAGFGSHVFRGLNRQDRSQIRFSYQEAEHRAYSLRADLAALRPGWEWGGYAAGSELEYDALRPEIAFNRHFWDRNGVIDSYQGSLLGVFNSETWLLNGAVYAAQAGGGLWVAKTRAGWRGEAGVGYGHLELEANSHLTKRETALLIAFREEDFERTYPKVIADVVTPELRVTGSLGRAFLAASAAQALPVRIRIERSGTTSGKKTAKAEEGISGGTWGRLELGWRIP
jgi:hypothetical protein